LRHVDPDILEVMEIEQKKHLLDTIINARAGEFKRMTIRATQRDVKRAIEENLEELVQVVIDNVLMLNKGVQA